MFVIKDIRRISSLENEAVSYRCSNLAFLLRFSSTSARGGEEAVDATAVRSTDDAGELPRRDRLRGPMGH
jgi:hypothetical protein